MQRQLSRKTTLSWLSIAIGLILLAAVAVSSLSANAAPLVANLSTSTLMVDKANAKANDTVTYTLVVKNTGQDGAGGVVVTHTLPAGMTFQGSPPSVDDNGVVTISGPTFNGQDMEWEGAIGVAAEATFTFSAKIASNATLGDMLTSNAAIAHSSGNVDLSATTTVVEAAPDVSTSTKSVNKDVAKVGDTVSYSLFVANTGDDAATISVTDTLPSELTYVANSASINTSDVATINSLSVSGGVLTWSGVMGLDSEATITFNATVNSGVALDTVIENTVQIDDGLAVTERSASTTVVLKTDTFLYLPVVSKPVPEPVAQISAVSDSNGNSTWTVSWNNVLPASGETYQIQEATDANFTQNVQTFSTAGFSRDFTHPSATGTTYYYRVRIISTPSSAYSNVVSVTLDANLTLDRPALSAGAKDCTLLRWNYQGISSFKINLAHGFEQVGQAGSAADGGDASVRVCPSVTTVYEAEVIFPDGRILRPSVTATVDNSDGKCNRDPYVNFFSSTQNPAPANAKVTLSWNVQCASGVFFRISDDENAAEVGVSGEDTREVQLGSADTNFYLRVTSSTPQGDFNQSAKLSVTISR